MQNDFKVIEFLLNSPCVEDQVKVADGFIQADFLPEREMMAATFFKQADKTGRKYELGLTYIRFPRGEQAAKTRFSFKKLLCRAQRGINTTQA